MCVLSCRYHPIPVTYGQQVHQVFPRSHCKVSKHTHMDPCELFTSKKL